MSSFMRVAVHRKDEDVTDDRMPSPFARFLSKVDSLKRRATFSIGRGELQTSDECAPNTPCASDRSSRNSRVSAKSLPCVATSSCQLNGTERGLIARLTSHVPCCSPEVSFTPLTPLPCGVESAEADNRSAAWRTKTKWVDGLARTAWSPEHESGMDAGLLQGFHSSQSQPIAQDVKSGARLHKGTQQHTVQGDFVEREWQLQKLLEDLSDMHSQQEAQLNILREAILASKHSESFLSDPGCHNHTLICSGPCQPLPRGGAFECNTLLAGVEPCQLESSYNFPQTPSRMHSHQQEQSMVGASIVTHPEKQPMERRMPVRSDLHCEWDGSQPQVQMEHGDLKYTEQFFIRKVEHLERQLSSLQQWTVALHDEYLLARQQAMKAAQEEPIAGILDALPQAPSSQRMPEMSPGTPPLMQVPNCAPIESDDRVNMDLLCTCTSAILRNVACSSSLGRGSFQI